jgi:hypothetical protein
MLQVFMSQYATVAEFKILGLPEEAVEELSDSDIEEQLVADAGVIDLHLPNATLPIVAPYPEFLKRCNVCLSVWHVLLRRGFEPEGIDDKYKLAHDECMALLEKVSNGKLTIPGLIDSTPTVSEGSPAVSTSALRGWGDTSPGWYE